MHYLFILLLIESGAFVDICDDDARADEEQQRSRKLVTPQMFISK